jgi:hypothetical protein
VTSMDERLGHDKEDQMRAKRRVLHRTFALLAIFTLATAGGLAAQNVPPNTEQTEDTAGFKEFTSRVGEYIELSKEVEKQLPAMKPKEELPEMIAAHQQARARKLREARPHARRGAIFTRASREAFRHVIRSVFEDPQAAAARAALQQKDVSKKLHLKVNGVYPDAVAETTFPPTLLQKLPTLPDELAYRIVGRDLILVDTKANLVVDMLDEALP